jgi:hypothetical protein
MPATIDSLLVKLGLDNDKKSFQEGINLFNLVKSRALLFGAAIGATAGVLGRMTYKFAESKDKLGKFSDVMSVSPQLVDSLGHALKKNGGSADDAFSSINKVADLIEQTQWGEIPEDAFKIAGLDPYLLRGVTDIAQAYERLADATKDVSPEARRRFFKSLGFDQAEITLFAGGADKMRDYFAESEKLAPVTREMIDNATALKDATTELTKAVSGITDQISKELAPGMTLFFQTMTELLSANRDKISEQIAEAIKNAPRTIAQIGSPFNLVNKIGRTIGEKAFGFGADIGQQYAPAIGETMAGILPKQSPGRLAFDFGAGIGRYNMQGTENDQAGYLDYFNSAGFDSQAGNTAKNDNITIENTINVDARDASDPQAVERAAKRGVEASVKKLVENTVNDMKSTLR